PLEPPMLATLDERDRRPLALGSFHALRLDLETQLAAGRQAGRDQVLHHLLLAVDHDPPPGQVDEVDPVAAASELEVDALVDQALAIHPLPGAAPAQELDRALLEDAGPYPALDVLATAALQDDRLDPRPMQQVRQQQAGRPGADHAHLRPAPGRAAVRRWRIA